MITSLTLPPAGARRPRIKSIAWLCFALMAFDHSVQAESAQTLDAEPITIPEAYRANLSLKTAPISFVSQVPHASGLALIAAGSSADSQVVVSAPVDGTVGATLPAIGQALTPGTVLTTLNSPQLAELRAAAQMAATRVQQAEQALVRDQKLFAEGLIATKRLQASQAELASARAAERAAQASLALVDKDQSSHGTQLTITTPTAGVLSRRLVQPGTRVTQGTPLFELSTTGQWWLLPLPVDQVPPQTAGASVHVAGCPDAPLRTVDATVDPDNQLLTLRAEPTAPCAALRPGQRVNATLWITTDTPTAAIPVDALSTEAGQWQVFVQRGDQFFVLSVTERAISEGTAFVVGAFKPNDTVVVAGANRLKAIRLGMGAE